MLILFAGLLVWQPAPAQEYITEDAERFAALLAEYPEEVTHEAIQSGYLKPGTKGIEIFTPKRIRNARHMAEMVNTYRSRYDEGVALMLPTALESANASRDILDHVQELLGQKESAPVYIVFGGNNSGGTATRKGLVIGLEVLSRFVETEAEAKKLLNSFIAHEVVHVYQTNSGNKGGGNLLHHSLREGFADFMENMVMGGISNAERERHTYGLANEAELWTAFQQVMHTKDIRSWMYNGDQEDRPADLGYWIGKRICAAYYAQASDKHQALQVLLRLRDPEGVLAKSGYNPG
jgi:hypothetical protein